MYKPVSTNLDFLNREKEVLEFWEKNDIFKKSLDKPTNNKTYTFYDGPPTANGQPHIGHVLTRVIKDLIPRYKTMKGYCVPRKAGWDTHGLPVELEIEKLLGLDGKDQIESYGVEPFIKQCKESVWKYKGMWEDFSRTVGFWADMDEPYVTYHDNYIESEWWALKEIFNKDLLYKGFKIVPYCPRCGTPLSSHEVAQGYKDIKEKSAIVKFKVKEEDAYILAWTTTPWTLPSNVALCVNPNEEYVKVLFKGEVLYLAKELANAVLGEDYTILESFVGKQLEHKEYLPLFDFVNPNKKCYFVTVDEFVTLSDGTGVVHIAPAFGEDDAAVGRKYDLPFVQLVDTKGEMTKETLWPNVFCKDADKFILEYLKQNNLLYSSPNFEHSYPHCWRCDTPLIYYARNSWFIKMTAVKDDLIKNNNTINWIPDSIGKGRFGNWLENVQDWGISRDRYWGTPLNIWECECGHFHSIGSKEELKKMSKNCPDDIELHKPYIDAVNITCPVCQKEMTRVPEVIDCWFDAGSMPFAQHHYPFENIDLFNAQFPADFISEAVDQTRGWFYTLLAISTILFDKAPYKNVIVLGLIQDENGQKMSKSKNNAVNPFEALQTYGADAIRWYFYSNSAPWLPNRFVGKSVNEQRKFMGTLWNTYAFFVLYANIDEFDATKYSLEYDKLSIMDKWLLSRLQSLVKGVDENLENLKITETARMIQDFVDELSNWYVRRSRERYWVVGSPQDKINAYMTLYEALVTVSKLIAPMLPFLSENIYLNLVRSIDKNAPESVHLCDYPIAKLEWINKDLEQDMDLIAQIVTLGRAARNTANIKNRQPLSKIYVKCDKELNSMYTTIATEELNIKEFIFLDDVSKFMSYSFKPQLKTLGKRFGSKINEIRTILSQIDGIQSKKDLDEKGFITITLSDGSTADLSVEDLLIETTQLEGSLAIQDRGISVIIDTNLTNELIEEGNVRECISKIQSMRKEADFNVSDHIAIYVDKNEFIIELFKNNIDIIKNETLAVDVIFNELDGFTNECNINGEVSIFGVKVIN